MGKAKFKTVKIQKIGRYSTDSVLKHTGKTWDQWVQLLTNKGAATWSHKEIIKLLANKEKLEPWWQQVVATGFEQHIGKKTEGVNAKGLYSVTATKTFPISQRKLWNWLTSSEGLAVWLEPLSQFTVGKGEYFEVEGGIYGEIRTLFPPDRIRIKWKDEDFERASYLHVGIAPRSADKCVWYLGHDDVPNSRMKEQLRDRWKLALEKSLLVIKESYSK